MLPSSQSSSYADAPQRIWCKICGISSVESGMVAEDAGADAIGLNFFQKSSRWVDAVQAAKICSALSCTKVGLFVDAPAQEVEEILHSCSLDLLQFHGDETPSFCRQFGLPYIKVIRMRAGTNLAKKVETFSQAWALMLDTYVDGVPGGTGKCFDRAQWPQASAAEYTRWILAGGLTPINVAQAIAEVRPFGVDVSGGVEGPVTGNKDHGLISKFVQEVRRVH